MLARSLQGFEFRSSQLQMALLIQDSIRQKTPTLIEAGTGTGKTFGYLVPVILSGKKSVISTGTKNLQEQIYFKDIPLLNKATHLNIDAVMMKGRENYLCLHKHKQYISQSSSSETSQEEKIKKLESSIDEKLTQIIALQKEILALKKSPVAGPSAPTIIDTKSQELETHQEETIRLFKKALSR